MYQKYAEAQGWRIEILDDSSTDLGGLKEIVFSIEGEGVFHKLRFESGGHRVQRVPETETQGRIHTSACTVAVLPEPEEVEIVIKPEDLRVDTCRAGGPGGQKVNKTSSAVRLTHIPTGIVVHCQDDKSQHKNRSKAMKILRTRLFDMEQAKQQAERSEMRRSQIGSGDRSERIRTYNFPQNRITDHRIHRNFTLLTAIDGDIGDLIDALIQAYKTERLAEIQKNGANLG
jgi:peptide chain release factor 1